jgi:hypothetical protein
MKFDGRWIEKVFRQSFPIPNLPTRKNICRNIRAGVSIFVPTLFSELGFMQLREAICVAMFGVFPGSEHGRDASRYRDAVEDGAVGAFGCASECALWCCACLDLVFAFGGTVPWPE